MRRWLLLLLLLAECKHAPRKKITIGAAISLKESTEALVPRLSKDGATDIEFAFGASGDLASQMVHGAPMDMLAAAGEEPPLKTIADETCTLAWNTLVLVQRTGGRLTVAWTSLESTPPSFRLAIGRVPTVPAGVYAEQALRALGAWDAIAPKIVRGTNVRNVLDLVARGEADAGIVYATDVGIRPDIESLGSVPAAGRPNVHYPLYVAKTASSESRAIARLLCDDETKRTLAAHGFLAQPPR